MVLPSKSKIAFKIISGFVAGIFLFQQIAWAGDLINTALEDQYREQSQIFAPDYLKSQETALESLINQKQDNEDYMATQAVILAPTSETEVDEEPLIELEGPKVDKSGSSSGDDVVYAAASSPAPEESEGAILSVTTDEGDVIRYRDGAIDSIERQDGTTLRDLVLDSENNLVEGEIVFSDGSVQVVAGGRVVTMTKPDGTVYNYNDDELISSIVYPDGRTAACSYVKDAEGNVIETAVVDSEKNSRYDSNGRLLKVEFNNGKAIEYADGVLSKAIDTDGTTYLYETTEVTEGDVTEYVAKLKTIISVSGVKYHIEDNNINSIELTDKSLSNFNLDESGKIINGQINYSEGSSILVENYKIKELTDANGIKTTYQYSPDGLVCDVAIDDHGTINIYRYIKDSATGKFTIENGNNTYEYNSLWQLERLENDLGVFEYSYDEAGDYLSASFMSPNGTIRQYNADLNLTETTLPDDTIYTYYDSGDFQGKPKQAILPDGKIVYFEYSITPEGNLKVYKRTSYTSNNLYQGSYSNSNIDYSLNPTLKASFKLDSSKNYSSVYAYAYYYGYNDKSVSLSLSVYGQNPSIYYYCYDYQTRQYVYDSKTLNMTINQDTDYTMEYVWTGSAVSIYVYESDGFRPADPVYTIANYRWNPSFSLGGSNANIVLDPSSSGTFTNYKDISTDYNDPLKGDPVHTTSFRFDSAASYKSLYYGVYGYSDESSDSVYLYYYNNTPELWVYHYDYNTYEYTYNSIPLSITFNNDTTYIIQTKLEDGTLKVYIYEEGAAPVDPVYAIDNVTWNPEIYADINGGDLDVEARDRLETYEYNSTDGRLLKYARSADNELLTYIYDEVGVLIRKELALEDGRIKVYDSQNRLLSETKPNGETTLYEYDEAGNVISITPQFPEGTVCAYYDSGAFEGKLKSATLPDDKTVYYEYDIAENGNLKVYKRLSYDDNSLYQYFYSNTNIEASLNPTLKASFKLDSDKYYPSVYANAYYYDYNDKHVSLSLNIYSQKAYIYYYTYNYVTRQYTNDSRELNFTINQDTAYTVEYVWAQGSVNVYLYEASGSRPATAIYTISNSNWNPRFSVGGNNANITLDPSSSGTYTTSKSISTDYSNPLKGSPIHTSTFSFEQGASNKSMYYSIYGNTATSSDSIYLSYYNNTATLYVYHYDYKTYDYTYNTITLSVTFVDNVNYTIQTKIENNILKLYIYETGTTPTNPVYTVENVTWDPQIYASIYGGDMTVDARDRLETYEYNTTSGILLDKDVEAIMRNKNIIIDDSYKTIPEYALASSAPLIFPDGKTDITSGAIPDIGFSVELLGTLFDLDGNLVTSSDFNDIPYFDVIRYGEDRSIREILKPSGEIVKYSEGLVDTVLQSGSSTHYSYTLDVSGNIAGITVDRDGVKRIYDEYGNLSGISAGGVSAALANGSVSRVEKEDGTIIEDAVFDAENNIVSAKITRPDGVTAAYSGGVLTEAHQPDGSTFYYDAAGNITQFINNKGIVYLYSTVEENGHLFTVASASDPDSLADPEDEIYRKYDQGKMLVEVKRKSGVILNYSYTKDSEENVTSTVVSDGATVTTYDANNNIARTEVLPTTDDPATTVSEYEYGRIRRVYKDSDLIYRYTYEFDQDGEEITVIEDMAAGDFKRYKDELLMSVTDSQNLVTSYEYDSDNKISRAVATYLGKVVNEYTYTYEGEDTVIEDSDGVKRTYNSANKLILLEEGGKTYAYTYNIDTEGREETVQELIGVEYESGSEVSYENGVLESIVRPDGSVLSDIVICNGDVLSYKMVKDGVTYYVENSRIAKKVKQDGTIIEYYGNGWIKSITTSEGDVANYDYEVLAEETLGASGSAQNIETGEILQLVSYPDTQQVLLLHLDGTDGSMSTQDSSLYNKIVTFYGNAHIDTTDKKFGSSSLVFDGNGDYLTLPDSDDWSFGTDDFTIDFWVKLNSLPAAGSYGVQTVCGQYTSYANYWNLNLQEAGNGTYRWDFVGVNAAEIVTSFRTTNISINTWYHITVVRTGDVLLTFQDGVQIEGYACFYGAMPDVAGSLFIGRRADGSGYFNGLIDELHVYKGIAKWTDDFTPPQQEYDSLLYNTLGYIVSNPIEINATHLDSISWNEYLPIGTDLTIQTRTGNTLNPDDGTWSIWSDPMTDPAGSAITSPAAKYIQYKVNLITSDMDVSPQLLPLQDGNFLKLDYIKKSSSCDSMELGMTGAAQDTEILSDNNEEILQLASYQNPQQTLLLHLDGMNGSNSTQDSSIPNHPIAFHGNAHLDTADKKFGSSSLAFDGNGDYLTLPDSDDWSFGADDFTIDFWVKFNTIGVTQAFIGQNEDANNYWYFALDHNNRLTFEFVDDFNISYTYKARYKMTSEWTDLTTGTWYHLAVVRTATTAKIFINGVSQELMQTDVFGTNDVGNVSGPLALGYAPATAGYLNGWIDELHMSKGVARWVDNFTPPQQEYSSLLYKTSGYIISDIIEINATNLSALSWNEYLPIGTGLTIQTRTGNTLSPDDGTWSAWSDPLTDPSDSAITSPAAKYVQYKVNMVSGDPDKTPQIIGWPSISYMDDRPLESKLVYVLVTEDGITHQYDKNGLDLGTLKSDFVVDTDIPVYLGSHALSDETVIQTKSFKDDSGHDITLQISKDNRFTYMVDGKVMTVHQKYDDGHVELIMEYSYDGEGNLILVRLPYARDSIDTQIATARQRIAEERANYLRSLAAQKGLAYTQIRDEVQVIRAQISSQRASLQSQLYQEVRRSRWVGWWIFGWWETYTERVEVPSVRSAINELNEQERQLNNQEAAAYAELNSEVSEAEAALNLDEEAALAEVALQEAQFHSQIIAQESTPVILEYYRAILGRDPDDAETETWLATVDYNSSIDVAALKQALMNSSERMDQEAFVAALKGDISDTLYNYLNSDEAGRASLLGTLGLSAAEAITLSQEDADAILSFLDRQNIHFGRSAFVSLGAVLADNGVSYNLEDLALKTVLIDIFTGSLNKFSEGNLLELSMYSLSKAASTYGIELNNTRLNYDELTEAFDSSGEIIAHLKNNHYVVVTNIAADGKVTYVEHNRGENGYSWTVSREDFENSWTAYTIAQKASIKGALPETVLAKKISDDTAMRVKGSCLPFLFPLLGAIFGAIAGAAAAVVGAISAIVTGISAIIAPIIAGIGELVAGVAGFIGGIGTQIFSAVQFVGGSLLPNIGGWLSGVGTWLGGMGSAVFGANGLGGILSATGFNLTGIGGAIAKTIVTTALSIGVSRGLEALGVNSTVSGLISSFVTGGVSGLFGGAHSLLSFVTGGLQGVAIRGVSELAPRLGIDPMLGNVISLAAGSIIGAVGNNISAETGLFDIEGFSASIGKQIMPNISGELAYYGITKAGEMLGVDPRISYLAGIGIRSSISVGLGNEWKPDVIWGSVTQGLLQGVTNIGLNFATEELGISPLLANIGFSAISGAINAGIQAATGGSKDVFGSLFKTYTDNALTFLGSGDPSNAWQQAAYISQILDFSEIVQERGLVDALNSYGAGFFNAVAVNQIIGAGYSLGDYFAEKLAAGQYTTKTLNDGTEVNVVTVADGQNNAISDTFFQQKQVGESTYWDLIGGEEFIGGDSYLTWGDFGVDAYGKLGYTDAELYSIFDSDIQYQRIIDGQQAYAEVKDWQGNTILVIEPTVSGHYNTYNSYGEYVEAKITNLISERSYAFNGLKLEHFSELDLSGNDSLLDLDLSNPDFVNLMLNNLSLSLSEATVFNNLTTEEKQQILHVLLFNGIGNPNPNGISPAYMKGFGEQLAIADPLAIQTTYIASYENSPGWTGKLRNCGMWVKDVYFSSDEVTNDILNEIYYKFNGNPPVDMVGLAYSGDGDPLLQALNKDLSLDMKSVVLVGAPLKYGRQILNTNVENLISIEGGVDAVVAFAGGYFGTFETNPNPLNLYRIALLGVDHLNYSYEPNPGNKNISQLKVKAARLVAEVTKYANNTIELNEFLNRTEGITYDIARKIYFVDLDKVTYDK